MTQSQLSPLELSIDMLRVLQRIREEHTNKLEQNEVQFATYFLDAFEERTPKVEDPNLVMDLCNKVEELIDDIEDETLDENKLKEYDNNYGVSSNPMFSRNNEC